MTGKKEQAGKMVLQAGLSRIRLYHVAAAAKLGKLSEAESIFYEQDTFEVDDQKEGEIIITEIWLDIEELRAKKKGIPPYMVASDRTLHEMCVLVPFEKEELLEVHGMGFKKYEQYGAVFLDKIQEVTAGDKKGYGISEDADGTDAVQNQNPLDIGPFGSVEN